jgi:hypothetical protein
MRAKLDRKAEAAAEKPRYIMESVGDDVSRQPESGCEKINGVNPDSHLSWLPTPTREKTTGHPRLRNHA